MFRIAVMIALVADLLVCPIRCGIHASDQLPSQSAKVASCASAAACCCDCEGQSPIRGGGQPISEHSSGDPACCCEGCFCDGAILPDVATFELDCPIVWLFSGSAAAGVIPARLGFRSLRDINPPPRPAGIDARVLYQSWQI